MNAFHAKVAVFIRNIGVDDDDVALVAEDFGGDDSDDENPFMPRQPVRYGPLEVETTKIRLPSTIGLDQCTEAGLLHVVKKELKLREGQANDALQGLRMAIARKSFIFRTTVRNARSKIMKTRAWDDIKIVTTTVQHHARIYSSARQAMVRLGASEQIMQKYKVLLKEDLRASTIIIDSNVRGERNSSMSWFWSLDVKGDSLDNGLMLECEYSFTSAVE